MPLRVFLSHASADKPAVEDVKRILDEGGDIECWLDKLEIGFGENIVSRISDGLAKSDFLLLFLTPASLKSQWVEEEWTALFYTQTNSGKTRLIPVLLEDCQLPTILQNKKFCDLRTNRLEELRRLKATLLREKPQRDTGTHAGASLPNFTAREAELADL